MRTAPAAISIPVFALTFWPLNNSFSLLALGELSSFEKNQIETNAMVTENSAGWA